MHTACTHALTDQVQRELADQKPLDQGETQDEESPTLDPNAARSNSCPSFKMATPQARRRQPHLATLVDSVISPEYSWRMSVCAVPRAVRGAAPARRLLHGRRSLPDLGTDLAHHDLLVGGLAAGDAAGRLYRQPRLTLEHASPSAACGAGCC